MEFPGDSVSQGSSVATAVAWVAAMAQIQSLAPELPQAVGAAKKKKKKIEKKRKENSLSFILALNRSIYANMIYS